MNYSEFPNSCLKRQADRQPGMAGTLTGRGIQADTRLAPSTVQAYRTGISRSTGQPVAVPRVVALACAALAAGLAREGRKAS